MSIYKQHQFESWHDLFDTLCNERGWYDNSDLASRYCSATGKKTQRDFESTRRLLQSWRSGAHTPLRRNFITLGKVLDVSRDPALERIWTELYRAAWIAAACAADVDSETADVLRQERRRWGALASALVLVGAILAFAILPAASNRFFQPEVGYDAHVRIVVGESRLVHGEVASCLNGGMADWQAIEPMVPKTRLGFFSDGGPARKMMNECGRDMLVRAVKFTAVAPGIEEVSLLGDYMKIEVVAKTE